MTDVELNKARLYAIDKMRYSEIHSIFNEIETSVKLVCKSICQIYLCSLYK